MERINSGGHAWHKRTAAFGNYVTYIQWNPVNTVTDRPKKLAVLTDDRINEGFFLQENVGSFC